MNNKVDTKQLGIKQMKTLLTVTLLAFFMVAAPVFAESPIYTGTFNNKAVGGYDTVSYFTGPPVKGSDDFKAEWRGANWYFSSQKNLEKFNANPEKYAPQYGGYCAWATAHGSLAKGDPTVYDIQDGKLYLNYNKSIQESWTPRKAELITKADAEYPNLVDLK